MMVWAILAIGALSFVVWAHHMYVSGMNPYFGFFFATTTLIIAVPTAIKVYNWVLTLWRGDVHLTVPMLFAIGFIFTFVNGGLTGLFLGNVTVDVPLSGTYFVVAHFHMVMGVSPILVVFGAIYHWYPKITGRMLERHARQGCTSGAPSSARTRSTCRCTTSGSSACRGATTHTDNINFIPESVHTANEWITISALLVAAAQMIFLFNLIWSYFKGEQAGSNPWRATSLEWQTPDTPPKHGNWGKNCRSFIAGPTTTASGRAEDFIPQNVPPDGHASRPARARSEGLAMTACPWRADHGVIVCGCWSAA